MLERVADADRVAEAELCHGRPHVVDESFPGIRGRGRRGAVAAEVRSAAGETPGELSGEGSQAEGIQAGTVDQRGRPTVAAEVVDGERDVTGARDVDGRHAGTLPPAVPRRRRRGGDRDRLQMWFVQHLLVESGYAALVVLAFAEACCVRSPPRSRSGSPACRCQAFEPRPRPGRGHHSRARRVVRRLWGGRVGGRPLVERLARYVLVTSRDIDRAERWLSGRGEFAVAPVGRCPSYAPPRRSSPGRRRCRSCASKPPTCSHGRLHERLRGGGFGVGHEWNRIAHDFSIAGYVLLALVAAVVAAFIVVRLRETRRERQRATAPPPRQIRGGRHRPLSPPTSAPATR